MLKHSWHEYMKEYARDQCLSSVLLGYNLGQGDGADGWLDGCDD